MSSKFIKIMALFVALFMAIVALYGCVANRNNAHQNADDCYLFTSNTTITTTAPTSDSTTTTTAPASTTATTTMQKPTTTTTAPRSTTTGTAGASIKDKVLKVPIIAQFPDYPTGCESVSAVMALRYYGESIDVGQFIDKHLPMSNEFKTVNGVRYGPNPYKHFVGHPCSKSSYGCLAPVIEKALISYFGSNERVVNTTGKSLSALCTEYIDKGEPVLVWATIGMIETGKGPSWKLEDGSTFYWPLNEHCMVLIGYDDSRYYFADPYRGMVKSYARWLCESRYKDIGMQSIAVIR